jgi:hypothetical protein
VNEDQNPQPNEPTAGQNVPYSRFKQVNDRLKVATAELEALRAGNGNAAPAATGNTDGNGNEGGNTPPPAATPAPAPASATPPAPVGNIVNRPVSGPNGSVAIPNATPDYKGMYEAAQAELSAMNLARLQDRTALAVGLPLELAPKLAGATEQEIRQDAERLARYVGNRPKAPNLNGSTPSGTDPGFSLAQIEDSAFYNANHAAIHAAFARGAIRR